MKILYSDKHEEHAPKQEFSLGKFDIYHETPLRAQFVLQEVLARKIGPVLAPDHFPIEKILRIQNKGYVDFLQTAHKEWVAQGLEGPAVGCVFNQHRNALPPKHIDGKLGYYLADTILSITSTSWEAIEASAFTALAGQKMISEGDNAAFALCRPPGHHATASIGSGYCFLNNAAIAAQSFIDTGCKRIAILDVDYHHGNGTQEIFYKRNDVMFVSLHADPLYDYPFFLGHADEMGLEIGAGFNINFPLALGTEWNEYNKTLREALAKVKEYAPEVLIVSLGVDTFKDDPISQFKIESEDYLKMGNLIAGLHIPTLFIMEGGYAVDEVGVNIVNVLEGFMQN